MSSRSERIVYQTPSPMYCDYCGSRILNIDKSGKCTFRRKQVCGRVLCENCIRVDKGRFYCLEHYEKKPCFIVTACYGSTSKYVMFLRNFRDNEVKTTKIGKHFMRYFDKVYYSFSPSTAKFIKRHKRARILVKNLFVVPLLRLLIFSERITRPIKNKEARVFATGALTTTTIFLMLYLMITLLTKLMI